MRSWWRIFVTTLFCAILASCYESTRRYKAWLDIDGKGPPGFPILASNGHDTDRVLLYRPGKNDVLCYDSLSSRELHDRLLAKNGMAVTVEYDVSSNLLGKVYGYNVRSVDGIILAKLPRGAPRGGGGVAKNGPGGRASGDDCW